MSLMEDVMLVLRVGAAVVRWVTMQHTKPWLIQTNKITRWRDSVCYYYCPCLYVCVYIYVYVCVCVILFIIFIVFLLQGKQTECACSRSV